MDKLFKWNMLTTSFIPLWVSVIIIIVWDIMSGCYISFQGLLAEKGIIIGFAFLITVLMIISFVSVMRFFKQKSKPNESSCVGKVLSARKSASIITDFLLAYILPMTAFNFTESRDIFLFLLYFGLIAFLSIRNGNVYTNILFEFMGFKMFTCEIERLVVGRTFCYSDCVVISKEILTSKVGQEFSFFDFDNNIYINLEMRKGDN